MSAELDNLAEKVILALAESQQTMAVAESLTGGLLSEVLTSVPGASAVFRGGAVTYSTESKSRVLGVEQKLLHTVGAVDAKVAAQMAHGAADLYNASITLATTGVAGPDGQDGKPVGTVFIACHQANESQVHACHFEGDRQSIREQTVKKSLEIAIEALADFPRA